MASYGAHFETVVPPEASERDGQCVTPTTGSRIRIGAPIEVDLTKQPNALGFKPVKLSTAGGTAAPLSGLCGILVYEEVIYRGVDPALTPYSDRAVMTTAPLGAAVQMISGRDVYVTFRNLTHQTFLANADLQAVTMVAGMGATPTVARGDYLAPGVGNDTDGYWAEVGSLSAAWLVVESINTSRGEVTCRVLI